jgi:hypothetical protein
MKYAIGRSTLSSMTRKFSLFRLVTDAPAAVVTHVGITTSEESVRRVPGASEGADGAERWRGVMVAGACANSRVTTEVESRAVIQIARKRAQTIVRLYTKVGH